MRKWLHGKLSMGMISTISTRLNVTIAGLQGVEVEAQVVVCESVVCVIRKCAQLRVADDLQSAD